MRLTLIRPDNNNCKCFVINSNRIKGVAMPRVVTLVVRKHLVQTCPGQ